MKANRQIIGLISDTHGLLRKSAADALRDVDWIVHAGDIGSLEILNALREIAPVYAVAGNMDTSREFDHLPRFDMLEFGPIWMGLIHDLQQLDLDPAATGLSVVVHGHTHRPEVAEKAGVSFINPGSAGPRRFRLPVSLGKLYITGQTFGSEIMELEV